MDFGLLDDVLLEAPNLSVEKILDALFSVAPATLGPIVEYEYLRAQNPRLLPPLPHGSSAGVVNAVQRFLESPARATTSVHALPTEVMRTPAAREGFEAATWAAFRMRLQAAAERGGLPKRAAQGIAGALDEMVSNILEHSEKPASGVAGYRWQGNEFEYVVADNGVGVLRSLRHHPDYAGLDDNGSALQLALSEGESRHGRGTCRGYGFRQVFLSLADLGAKLRFRSGDRRLEIEGISPTLRSGRIAASADFKGFLIAVRCGP